MCREKILSIYNYDADIKIMMNSSSITLYIFFHLFHMISMILDRSFFNIYHLGHYWNTFGTFVSKEYATLAVSGRSFILRS